MKNYLFNILMTIVFCSFAAYVFELNYFTFHRPSYVLPEQNQVIQITGDYNKKIYISQNDLYLLYANYVVAVSSIVTLIILIYLGIVDLKKLG